MEERNNSLVLEKGEATCRAIGFLISDDLKIVVAYFESLGIETKRFNRLGIGEVVQTNDPLGIILEFTRL